MVRMQMCYACHQRGLQRIATHVMDTPKKGVWYLCTQHADAVNKTLYGPLNNLRPLTREEYAIDNTE